MVVEGYEWNISITEDLQRWALAKQMNAEGNARSAKRLFTLSHKRVIFLVTAALVCLFTFRLLLFPDPHFIFNPLNDSLTNLSFGRQQEFLAWQALLINATTFQWFSNLFLVLVQWFCPAKPVWAPLHIMILFHSYASRMILFHSYVCWVDKHCHKTFFYLVTLPNIVFSSEHNSNMVSFQYVQYFLSLWFSKVNVYEQKAKSNTYLAKAWQLLSVHLITEMPSF